MTDCGDRNENTCPLELHQQFVVATTAASLATTLFTNDELHQ